MVRDFTDKGKAIPRPEPFIYMPVHSKRMACVLSIQMPPALLSGLLFFHLIGFIIQLHYANLVVTDLLVHSVIHHLQHV